MPPGNLEDWVALALLRGVGPITLHRALARYADPGEIAYRLSPSAWLSLRGVGPETMRSILDSRVDLRKRVDREMGLCGQHGIQILTLDDPGYPALLRELPDSPVVLYLRGSLPERVVRIAIVGSRRATAYGRRVAVGLGSALAARGIEVVSGGARGIDTHAHRGALEGEGRTVAVLGSGLLEPYPRENDELFETIASRGALVSEFPLDAPPLAEHFPRRNRLISGLSAAVVVVEAAPRSGSLITVSHALEQGREVLAVPGPVSSEQSQGCHRLIQQGAKLVQEASDIIEELSPMYTAVLPVPRIPGGDGGAPDLKGLTEDETKVLALVEDDPEPVHIDILAERAPFGLGMARLQTALFALELRGLVEQTPGRYYVRRLGGSGGHGAA